MKLEDMVIASVDDHLIEPPNMFEHPLPADVEQPRVVDIEGGAEIWVWGDTKVINIGLNAVVGRPKNEWGMEPARFSHMRKAAYDVDARVGEHVGLLQTFRNITPPAASASIVGVEGRSLPSP